MKEGEILIKKITLPYALGILIVFLFGVLVFILRQFTLSDAETGFLAASFGGLVSGGLTLIGVKATLDNQNKKDFIELYPKRKLYLDQLSDKMIEVIDFFGKAFGDEFNEIYYSNFYRGFNREISEFDRLIDNSTLVNGEVYSDVKEFNKKMMNMELCVKNNDEKRDEITGEMDFVGHYVDKREDYKCGLSELRGLQTKIKKQIKTLDNKYEKLTGL